jgi:hypothetical protein
MKIQACLCTILALWITAFTASGPVEAQDWARKMFKQTQHDFGSVLKGEMPEHRFEIENIYKEDVVIERVTTSCPCIIATLVGSKNVVKTFEKTFIQCKFNSPAFDGQRKVTVTVRFRQPFVAEVQLNLSGNIVRGVNFTPNVIEFGQVSASNLTPKTIKLASSGNPDFRVLDIKSTFPHIKVQLRETSRTGTLVTYDMTVRLKETVPSGFTQGQLFVVVQEGNISRQIPINFTVQRIESLQLPESISIGPVNTGQEIRRRVILMSKQEFRVTDVTCPNTAYRVKANGRPGKTQFVEVLYRAPDKPGEYEDELTFYVDNRKEPAGKLKVYVQATATNKPLVTEN